MKSFGELMGEIDYKDPKEVEPVCTDEEAEKRAEVFLNGYKLAEELHRKIINSISFQLNKRFAEGCQVKELLQLYNKRIGGFLDDFVY